MDIRKFFSRAPKVETPARPVSPVDKTFDNMPLLMEALSNLQTNGKPLRVSKNSLCGPQDDFSFRLEMYIPIDQQPVIKQAIEDMNQTLGKSILYWSQNEEWGGGHATQVVLEIKPAQMAEDIAFLKAYAARDKNPAASGPSSKEEIRHR